MPDANNIGRFQYTGQAWVPELGMFYYKARMYSPTLGRFMQTDPIGYGDGMNMYAYVGNDPVNGVDPSGMCLREISRSYLHIVWNDVGKSGPSPGDTPRSKEIITISTCLDFGGPELTPGQDPGRGGDDDPEICDEINQAVADNIGNLGRNVTTPGVWSNADSLGAWERDFQMNLDHSNFIISAIDAGEDLATLVGGAGALGLITGQIRMPRNRIPTRANTIRGGLSGVAVLAIRRAAEATKAIAEGQLAAVRARIRQIQARDDEVCTTPRHNLSS